MGKKVSHSMKRVVIKVISLLETEMILIELVFGLQIHNWAKNRALITE